MATIPVKSWHERLWRVFGSGTDGVFNSRRLALRTVPATGSLFDETLTVQRTPINQLNSSYGLSLLRDLEEHTGSGSASNGTGTIDLATGTTTGSVARLKSAEVGRYSPGFSAQIGIGVLIPTDPVGTEVFRWGGISAGLGEGFYFGKDATGVFVARRDGGTETKVYQSAWNLDKLDGTGSSGYTLDTSRGAIFHIDFVWYGHGPIIFSLLIRDLSNLAVQYSVPVHSMQIDNQVSVRTPNLHIFADVNNGNGTNNLTMEIGGRQYSVVGNINPRTRIAAQEVSAVSSIGTSPVPLATFQRKSGFEDRSIKIQGFDLSVATEDMILEVYVGTTLDTNASFGTPTNHTASETALEVDVSAQSFSGGVLIWKSSVLAGQGNNQAGSLLKEVLDIDVPGGQNITFAARTLANTGTVNVGVFRMTEEW